MTANVINQRNDIGSEEMRSWRNEVMRKWGHEEMKSWRNEVMHERIDEELRETEWTNERLEEIRWARWRWNWDEIYVHVEGDEKEKGG